MSESLHRSSRALAKRAVTSVRRLQMKGFERARVAGYGSSRKSKPQLFNLDLHISVIADLAEEIQLQRAAITRWSISGHNFAFRKVFQGPDPVEVVNSSSWAAMSPEMIDEFQDRYGAFLRTFDGFVATYTPAFAELFRGLDRPILTMSATRYEAPYTDQRVRWGELDQFFCEEVSRGRMILAANNMGDRDYVYIRTGLRPRLVPSLCDYTKATWKPRGGEKLIRAKSNELVEQIKAGGRGDWYSLHDRHGSRYSWAQLFTAREVVVIPYNISTMSMFEFATAGVPVSVPSPRLLIDLKNHDPGILSELTWFQVRNLPVPAKMGIPFDEECDDFLPWWLERADFYNPDLMPNVRVFESFDELTRNPHPVNQRPRKEWDQVVQSRNDAVRERRRRLIRDFLDLCS